MKYSFSLYVGSYMCNFFMLPEIVGCGPARVAVFRTSFLDRLSIYKSPLDYLCVESVSKRDISMTKSTPSNLDLSIVCDITFAS